MTGPPLEGENSNGKEADSGGTNRRTRPSGNVPVHGAFWMEPSNTGDELDDVLFKWRLRFPDVPAPAWQNRLHEDINSTIAFVSGTDLETDDKRAYLQWLRLMYSAACVHLAASPRAPTAAATYTASLDLFKATLMDNLDHHIAGIFRYHLRFAGPAFVILAAAGAFLLYWLPDSPKAGNYTLAAAAALGGMIVSDQFMNSVNSRESYAKLRRELRHPVGRIIGTTILAVFASLAVSSGFITITIGKWTSADLGKNTELALAVGFLAGIPSSFLVRRLFATIRGSGKDASAPKSGHGIAGAKD